MSNHALLGAVPAEVAGSVKNELSIHDGKSLAAGLFGGGALRLSRNRFPICSFLGGRSHLNWSIRPLIWLVVFTLRVNGWSAETGKHDEAVAFLKSYFESPPIVANCVVERVLFQKDGTEVARQYFQFRHQPGAYIVRQIPSTTPPEELDQAPIGDISGSVEGSVWYYHQGTHVRLPGITEPNFFVPEQGEAYVAATTLNSVLFWGINDVRPETLKWSESGKFNGATRRGGTVEGRILDSIHSRPIAAITRYNAETMHIFVDFKYDLLSFGNFPSELHFSVGSEKGPGFKEVVYRIHTYETNAVPLEDSFFKLSAYYKPPGTTVPEIIYTNNTPHRYEDGRLVPAKAPPTANRLYVVRAVYSILILSLSVGLFLVWRRARTNSR